MSETTVEPWIDQVGPEVMRTIDVESLPAKFTLQYKTVTDMNTGKITVQNLGIVPRQQVFVEPIAKINGTDYWCGCGRVFTYESFRETMNKVFEKLNFKERI